MSKKTQKVYVYYFSGGIGAFLLGVHFLECVREAAKEDSKFVLLCGSGKEALEPLLKEYPYIQIIDLRASTGTELFPFLGKKLYVLFSPAFAKAPIFLRIFFRILTVIYGGHVSGFTVQGRAQNFLSSSIPQNFYQSIFSLVLAGARYWGISVTEKTPTFLYENEPDYHQKQKTIIFHPNGKGSRRTYPISLSNSLLKEIQETFPDYILLFSGSLEDKEYFLKLDPSIQIKFIEGNSLYEKISTIKNTQLFIGVDTGVTHLAALLGVQTLVLGNLSNPYWLPTYRENVSVLTENENCLCNGDKYGDCKKLIDGKEYFSCMIDIPLKLIKETMKDKLTH